MAEDSISILNGHCLFIRVACRTTYVPLTLNLSQPWMIKCLLLSTSKIDVFCVNI
jgi:hypothetical protein